MQSTVPTVDHRGARSRPVSALRGTPVFRPGELQLVPLAMKLRDLVKAKERGHEQHWALRELRARIEASGLDVVEARGYRLFSLIKNWLEDYRWYYRLHRWCGRRFPGWCVEATVGARRELARDLAEGAGSRRLAAEKAECDLSR